ncbi:MAG TPA: TauD/TfdA family dioxygenase [Kofleriaceae bacterium]|nr:TauD/TfdA family dioxygenase [Kofleriaceae bacterium]
MKTEPFSKTFGTILHGSSGSLLDLDRQVVANHLRDAGLVLLRGFNPSEDEFAKFNPGFGTQYVAHLGGIRGAATGSGTDKPSLNPERGPVEIAGKVQTGIHTATRGTQGINPHSEASYSPMSPDLLWFYCRIPNAPGEGRTGFVDGIDIFRAMSDATREAFTKALIRWHVRVPRSYLEEQLRARFEDLAKVWLDGRSNVKYTIHPDNTIEVEYIAPSIRTSKFGSELGFCNSLLSRMPFREVVLDDLHRFVPDLPRAPVAEAMERAHDNMKYLDWETGDVVFVDNTRVMHAREPFIDSKRTLWVVTMAATSPVWKTRHVA